jgi:glutamate:GABA antiporter
VTGGLALLTMIADLSFTSGNAQRYFSVSLAVAVALIVLAYLLIFPAFVALRLREPRLERPFRVPGGNRTAWLLTGLTMGWSLLSALCLLWPGFGMARPDAALPLGFAGDRSGFELLVLGPIVALLLAYAGTYLLHRSPVLPREPAAAEDQTGVQLMPSA